MPESVLEGLGTTAPTGSVLDNAQPKPAPITSRSFTDMASTRKNIYSGVEKAVNSIGPLSNTRHTLTLHGVHYIDPEEIDLPAQKKAIMTGKTLHRRLRGTWRLTDNESGNKLDERELTLAQVPYLSPRGTFIINGTEMGLSSQMRLHPGIFTRVKENGEVESHINVMPGNGISHRYFLDPETGVFKINIGQAKLPLLPVLKALGIKDSELRKSWGDELVNANLQSPDGKTINKLYQRLIRKPEPDATEETKAKAIADLMHSMKLDPEVTKRTLGRPHQFLTKDAILDTTKKLIRVSRQEEDPDDRDHLAFQTFYGPEDLLSERITKDKAFLRQLLWKASFKGDLSRMPSGVLTKQLLTTIRNTGLGQAVEGINPAELLDAMTRSTRLGEGGIGSLDAVPDESRNVSPSQFGFIDPVKTAESAKTGIDARLATVARKGSDNKIYTPIIDVKTGKSVYKTPQDLADYTLAFPGELAKNKPYVAAMVGGTTKFVPREQVRYEMPHMENAFSPLANMIPIKSASKGQRMSMGARYLAQALSLKDREAPLLQSAMPGRHMEKSFEDHFGENLGAIRANQGGYVKKVTPDGIIVKNDDGEEHTYEMYNNFPGSRKSYTNNIPTVSAGSRIEPNQLLATSNYTDDKGTSALGINGRVAFIPFRGANYEDAIVISDAFAKKLTSQHMYHHDQEWSDNIRKGLKPFISLFPTEFSRDQLSKLGEDGIVKPGQEVHYGDPLVLVAEEQERSHSQVHRSRKPTYSNKTVLWEHHEPGEVTDVADTGKGVRVAIKSEHHIQVGDKLTNRFGGKGICSEIVPDDQMLHDENGNPFDVALNPGGMISRINPVQIAETVLSKIAKKTGIPYKIEDFANIPDLMQFVKGEMKKYNVKDLDTITDPNTGRIIPNVLTGSQYILKLQHESASKLQGRSIGGYTAENIPATGENGSKKIAMLETNALLSHGATEFIRDAHLIRGQKNEPYWQQVMAGFSPADPKVPLIYQKYVDSLKGSGVNVVRDGGQVHIMALTDKDVNEMAGTRNLSNADTVDWKEGLKPKKGGLFDVTLTGGHGGNRWAAIKLHEPMPNPAFEEPIRHMLDLTQKQFVDVLAGKEKLASFGSGPKAIKSALENINIDKSISLAEIESRGSKKGARDDAVRKLQYLRNAKRLNIHPKDWILSRVPVLPSIFRPVSVMKHSGSQLISDPNYLYKEVFDANEALQDLSGKVEDVGPERLNVYNAFKAVVGLGDPIQPKNQERQVKGLLQHVFGSSPKFGMIQRQLLGAAVELVGRGVSSPDPNLDMDHLGIPEASAWPIYKPFIIRRLVQKGVPRLEAARNFQDRTEMARKALTDEMEERPVVMSRAPTLHRYGILGFKPKLVKGDVVTVPPLVVAGFGLDMDGDQINFHVPASDAARKEVLEKMLPSKNLLSSANFKVHYMPRHEYLQGIYHASVAKDEKRRPVVFRNKQDALKAYHEGRINADTPVEIVQH